MRSAILEQFPAGTRVSPTAGGFFLWVQLPAGFDSHRLSQISSERGVLFAPGRIFSVSGDLDRFLRIGWGGGWNPRVSAGIGAIASTARRLNRNQP